MKKFVMLFAAFFIGIAFADTKTINWKVDGSTYDTTTCTVGGDLILPTAPTKYGYTFQGWELLYTPIEYIESTGTQYIDTGVAPNQNTRVVMQYMITTNDFRGFIFGARQYMIADTFGELYAGDGNWRSDYGTNDNMSGPVLGNAFYNQKIRIDRNKNATVAYNENNTILVNITHTPQTFQTSFNVLFPGMNNGGTYQNPSGNIRIYYFQIYDDGTLVRDMIPVLDPNNGPCMYDMVSGTYFYNAGTGNFIAGPVISE